MRGASNGFLMMVGVIAFVEVLADHREYWFIAAVIWGLLALHFFLTRVEIPAKQEPPNMPTDTPEGLKSGRSTDNGVRGRGKGLYKAGEKNRIKPN